ncbi:uncharacterized protein LOC127004355 isoform X3 [Eriocheir sinensis]|uniref:uncharacterized protein LOC127004355 isoform X3 n=1 Tax=Eriocheir sinensis TaxID=95602 RepID=UPI0021C70262|nr:uncharacterized protein LOC127004355 isoform X3 [Eriocheir sinensis]
MGKQEEGRALEKPVDANLINDNGAMSSMQEDSLTSNENGSTDSVYSYENRVAMELLYNAVTDEQMQVKCSRAAAAQRARRRKELKKMTEEEIKARRAAAARAQRKNRQKRLEMMTDDQRAQYRAAVANAQRVRRHLRLDKMSEEERRSERALQSSLAAKRRRMREEKMSKEEIQARRAAAAALQRRKRQMKREQMSDDELKERRAAEAALRRQRRQTIVTEEEEPAPENSEEPAKKVRRHRQKEYSEKDEEFQPQGQTTTAGGGVLQHDYYHYRKEYGVEGQQPPSMEGDPTPENLMVQILMQAQNAAAHQSYQDDRMKMESSGPHYPSTNQLVEAHHLAASYAMGQAYQEMPQNDRKDMMY